MKKIGIYILMILLFNSCKEVDSFRDIFKDDIPPGEVILRSYKPLNGGARFYYTAPNDEDLLKIEAEYTSSNNKKVTFAASYFVDSLEIFGFSDESTYSVDLYAVDRSGNRSKPLKVDVQPLKPAYKIVAESISVKPGFGSFFVDWKNDLRQNVNVHVNFEFEENGVKRSLSRVFSSNLPTDRSFIKDLDNAKEVNVKIRVEDLFNNSSEYINKGTLTLLEDFEIPKAAWKIPNANDSIGGVPMCFGDGLEGKSRYVIDGIIDRGDNNNFMHTNNRGRTGRSQDGNMPWNYIIDLGDTYELSRIVTVQRHQAGVANITRGHYYMANNVGVYRMYYWDEDKNAWQLIGTHQIPVPQGISELEFVKLGEAGDMAYMYPDNPQFTKKTRWFRYEAVKGFTSNYTLEDALCLSEITLFGKPLQK